MPASAPISEVLAVMPSVTMSCTPMIAPTTQSGAISSSEPSSRKRGWRRACVGRRPAASSAVSVAHLLPLSLSQLVYSAALPAAGCQP